MTLLHRFLRHEVLRESSFIALAQALVVLLGVANSVLLARLLEPEQLGGYQFLLAWAAVAAACGLPGMAVPLLKSTLKNYDRFFWLAIRRSMLAANAGALVVGAIGAVCYWGDAEWRPVGTILLLVAASMPIAGFQNYESVLIGKASFRISRLLQLFASVSTLVATVTAAWAFKSAEHTYAAYVVSRVLVMVAALAVVRRRLQSCIADSELDAELLAQGWRQTALAFFILAASRLDRIALGTLSPALLAQYHIGTLIPISIKNNVKLLLSVLGTRWGKRDASANLSALNRRSIALWLAGLFCFLSMFVVLPFVIPMLFGEGYTEAVQLGIVFSLTLVPAFWSHMIGLQSQIQSSGKFNQISQAIRYGLSSLGILMFGQLGVEWVIGSIIVADFFFAIMSGAYLFSINRREKQILSAANTGNPSVSE